MRIYLLLLSILMLCSCATVSSPEQKMESDSEKASMAQLMQKATEAAQKVINSEKKQSVIKITAVEFTKLPLDPDFVPTPRGCGTHQVCLDIEPYCEEGDNLSGGGHYKVCGTKLKCKTVVTPCASDYE